MVVTIVSSITRLLLTSNQRNMLFQNQASTSLVTNLLMTMIQLIKLKSKTWMVRPSNVVKRSTIKYGLILVTSLQQATFKQLVSQITTKKLSSISTLLKSRFTMVSLVRMLQTSSILKLKMVFSTVHLKQAWLKLLVQQMLLQSSIQLNSSLVVTINLISQLLLKTLMLTTV